MSSDDESFLEPIVASLTDWLPRSTCDVWNHDEMKDVDRKVEAALKFGLKPQSIVQATEDVQIALNKEGHTTESATIKAAREEAQKEAKKIIQQAKKDMQIFFRSAQKPMCQGPESMVRL